MDKNYAISSVAGIISIILIVLDWWFITDGIVSREIGEYNIMQIKALVSIIVVVIFMSGFVLLGFELKNKYFIVSSSILLITNAFFILSNFFMSSNVLKSFFSFGSGNEFLYFDEFVYFFMIASIIISFIAYPLGVLLFGIGIFRLNNVFGDVAKITGFLEICVFLYVILIFYGAEYIDSSLFRGLYYSMPKLFSIVKLFEVKILYDFMSQRNISE